ncbi:MAG: hypothetical protein ABI085_11230 [Gemmatimonadaceae bacterium]
MSISTKKPADKKDFVVRASVPTTTPMPIAAPRVATRPASPESSEAPFLGTDDSPPRFEPWLAVTLLTFLPGSLIFFLPHALLTKLLVPICVAMAAFFLSGFGMLLRDRTARRTAGTS